MQTSLSESERTNNAMNQSKLTVIHLADAKHRKKCAIESPLVLDLFLTG